MPPKKKTCAPAWRAAVLAVAGVVTTMCAAGGCRQGTPPRAEADWMQAAARWGLLQGQVSGVVDRYLHDTLRAHYSHLFERPLVVPGHDVTDDPAVIENAAAADMMAYIRGSSDPPLAALAAADRLVEKLMPDLWSCRVVGETGDPEKGAVFQGAVRGIFYRRLTELVLLAAEGRDPTRVAGPILDRVRAEMQQADGIHESKNPEPYRQALRELAEHIRSSSSR